MRCVSSKTMQEHAAEWKAFRRSLAMTQVRFASAIGVHPRTVQGIEGAHRLPSYESRRAFDGLKSRTSNGVISGSAISPRGGLASARAGISPSSISQRL